MTRQPQRKRCDGAMAITLIHNEQDRIAVTRRNTTAAQEFALPAAHLDRLLPKTLATAIVGELGVHVEEFTLARRTGLVDACPTRARSGGHTWWCFDITATGHLDQRRRPSDAAGLWWLSRIDVQALAQRTCELATGELTVPEWRDYPGLDPSHALILADHGWVNLLDDHSAVEVLAKQGL